MSTKTGIRCKAYYNSSVYATPVWVEVDAINDWKESVQAGSADFNSRASLVDGKVKTSLALSWSGNLKRDGSVAWGKVREAALTNAVLDMLILDGKKDVTDVVGFRADVQVFKLDNDQGRGAAMYDEVELMPTISTNPVKAVKVTAGAPTYADLSDEDAVALTYA